VLDYISMHNLSDTITLIDGIGKWLEYNRY
jgi:hypothetical protein